MNVAGRQQIGLIDLGSSPCCMSPETTVLCELQFYPEILHLEFADGSKVESPQKAENISIVVGKSMCHVNFIVTKLLRNVDLVLGVNWLALWNPVIDWRKQQMTIWIGKEWSQV